jgi:hypothetical protein
LVPIRRRPRISDVCHPSHLEFLLAILTYLPNESVAAASPNIPVDVKPCAIRQDDDSFRIAHREDEKGQPRMRARRAHDRSGRAETTLALAQPRQFSHRQA